MALEDPRVDVHPSRGFHRAGSLVLVRRRVASQRSRSSTMYPDSPRAGFHEHGPAPENAEFLERRLRAGQVVGGLALSQDSLRKSWCLHGGHSGPPRDRTSTAGKRLVFCPGRLSGLNLPDAKRRGGQAFPAPLFHSAESPFHRAHVEPALLSPQTDGPRFRVTLLHRGGIVECVLLILADWAPAGKVHALAAAVELQCSKDLQYEVLA